MRYLLDTNAISETLKKKPDPNVVKWLGDTPLSLCALSVITIGEIRSGVERMRASPARERNRFWLERTLPETFGERILPITRDVADRWGRLVADTHRQPLHVADSLIAATALAHGLTLVTRDAVFERVAGLLTFNPWVIS
jgi:predicted nucleic acid-binding protein